MDYNNNDILVVVKNNIVNVFFKGKPLKTIVYNADTDKVESVSQVPTLRSFNKIIKDTKESSH